MLSLTPGMTLYHGSYVVVDHPDLERCAPLKDFGRGFYLTTSLDQARSFTRLSARKARANGFVTSDAEVGHVSVFRFSEPADGRPLDIRTFATADAAWLRCIVAHRKPGQFLGVAHEYAGSDIIIGKVANDRTNATVVAYMSGLYGPLDSDMAADTCIRLLIPERLEDQLCFRTRRALDCLEFMGSEEVRL